MLPETECPVCGAELHVKWCPQCGYNYGSMQYFTEGDQPQRKKRGIKKRYAGTNYQREVLKVLFAGGFMAKYNTRYRVWDKQHHPLRRFASTTFLQVKKFCRQKNGAWVIDLKKVRSLRRNTWVKQYYNSLKKK